LHGNNEDIENKEEDGDCENENRRFGKKKKSTGEESN
jgi:hypothetical protein